MGHVWIAEVKYRHDPGDTFAPMSTCFWSREAARDEAKRHAIEWPGTFRYRVRKYVRRGRD
jgi:hypothetical protein